MAVRSAGADAASPTSSTEVRWHRPAFIAAVAIIACAAVISRRVDAVTNPQFFAEDGSQWFADAYKHGPLAALDLATVGGYLQVVSRLGPVLAAPFGIANAPGIFNTLGLLLQVAPVLFLLSRRFDAIVPSLWTRVGLSAVYLLMPSTELNITITSSQFHLAVLATLVIIAPAPGSWGWRVFDVVVAMLCGLSGPFAYILFPVSVLWFVVRRSRFTLVLCVALAIALGVQLYVGTLHSRIHFGLGASAQNLVLILGDRVVLAGVFSEQSYTHLFHAGADATLVAALVCLLALPIIVFAALKAPVELRFFGLVSLCLIVAGLASPLVSANGNQWHIMATSAAGDRYFFMARISWVITLVWAASQLPRVWMQRAVLAVGAVAFASGLIAWRYPPFVDYHWPAEARTLTAAAPGTHLVLPINPGGGWAISLTAK